MPPTSNTRKTSTATMTMTESHHPFYHSSLPGHPTSAAAIPPSSAVLQPRRSTSGRAIRINTTRPTNYYARAYGPGSASAGGYSNHDAHLDSAGGSASNGGTHHGGDPLAATGFFPALTYFSDAITALPKEVMRQFTLMKEVEAKIHGPSEQLSEQLDSLLAMPVPSRQEVAMAAALRGTDVADAAAAVAAAAATGTQGLVVGSTANNSVTGSANASLVNGVAGGQRPSVQFSATGSVHSEDFGETEAERTRRTRYHELRMLLHGLLANVDEKNVVLAEASRVLGLQELRIESVMPHVENEIHEEAWLGSATHWAYAENRQKKQSAGAGAANRRDVAATNNLAMAANALHEHDIAQARRDAGREATREKTKRRMEPPGDSDFDEKPRRGPKGAKGRAAASALSTGLGISTNGEPAPKRKKTEKAAAAAAAAAATTTAAVGMERTVSATGRTLKAPKDTPRSTPAVETGVKKPPKSKPAPPIPKKKLPPSVQASPMLVASSPLISTFNSAVPVEPPSNARPQSARLRQNSGATNPRVDKLAGDESSSRPGSAGGKVNGNVEKPNGRRKAPEPIEGHEERIADENMAKQLKEVTEELQRDDVEMRDADQDTRPVPSRSNSSGQKNSGRASKVGTPRNETFADRDVAMSRTRSTRSRPGAKGESRDSSSSEPQPMMVGPGPGPGPGPGKHRRIASNSNLVKQLAPFNRSPDLDRHRSRDDMDEDLDSLDERNQAVDPPVLLDEQVASPVPIAPESERETRRTSVRRPPRNSTSSRWRGAPGLEESSPEPTPPASTPATRNRQPATVVAVATSAPAASPISTTTTTVKTPAPDEEPAEAQEEEEDDEDSEHDPDDPNEPKYCYCNRGSYGEMVACDNDACPREWFHLGCTELREAPGEEEKWYCNDCRPKSMRKGRGGRGVVGR